MANEVNVCTLLILKRQGEILLAMKKRGFGEGRYNGCGGKVKSNETIEQAMLRESQEEIGVEPTVYRKVAIQEFLFPGGMTDVLVHTYLATEWHGEPIESEEMRPAWFRLQNIPYDQMWEDDQVWLPYVLTGKKMHCQFYFDKDDHLLKGAFQFADSLE